jgi:Glycosyl hydrolase catalytic core
MRRALLTCLLVLLATPAAAAARPLEIGLGDQNPLTYSDPKFRALKVRHARLVLAWDWYRSRSTIAATDQWIAAARDAGLRPLVAFNRNWRRNGDRLRPSLRAYRRGFRTFRRRYPDVRDFTAWNEANHSFQPTWRHPRVAARYYNALRSMCPRCRIVAADVLDSDNMLGWIQEFKRHARRPRLWGLHNYKDVNDGTTWRTASLLRAVRGRVWLTETGGILRLKPVRGSRGNGRRHTRSQQAEAVRRVFRIARSFRRIDRVYFYEWRANPKSRWDSALFDADGTPRPAYRALKSALRGGRR